MNEMFPNAQKVTVPLAVKYPFEFGDEEFHPTDAKFHYQDLLVKLFGEDGYEMAVVDVEEKGNFLVLSVI
jgi:hypothetical protein